MTSINRSLFFFQHMWLFEERKWLFFNSLNRSIFLGSLSLSFSFDVNCVLLFHDFYFVQQNRHLFKYIFLHWNCFTSRNWRKDCVKLCLVFKYQVGYMVVELRCSDKVPQTFKKVFNFFSWVRKKKWINWNK